MWSTGYCKSRGRPDVNEKGRRVGTSPLLHKFDILTPKAWFFSSLHHGDWYMLTALESLGLAPSCQTKAMTMELSAFIFTADIFHQCSFLPPAPSSYMQTENPSSKLEWTNWMWPETQLQEYWAPGCGSSQPPPQSKLGTAKRKCFKWVCNRLVSSDSGRSIWLSLGRWQPGDICPSPSHMWRFPRNLDIRILLLIGSQGPEG